MITNDYTSDPGKYSRRRTCSCECNLARLKRRMDLSLFVPAPARASRAASGYAGSPDLPFAGLRWALGSLPDMKLEILTSTSRNRSLKDKCAMGIMIKTPRNGFSKTRLSPPLSSEEGASISRCFLRDTCASIETLSQEDPFVVGVAIYTPVGSEADLQQILPSAFRMIAQREGGIGVRLSGATEDLFSIGFSAVCLIDSDSPTLPLDYLRDLSNLLKEPKDRMVIGPCSDGGYYLLGLRHAHTRLFEEINWSSDSVYSEPCRGLRRSICRPLRYLLGTTWMTRSH